MKFSATFIAIASLLPSSVDGACGGADGRRKLASCDGIKLKANNIKLNYIPSDGAVNEDRRRLNECGGGRFLSKKWEPDNGGNLGDLYTFNDDVKEGDTNVGMIRGSCTKIHMCEPNILHCEMSVNFNGKKEYSDSDKIMIMGDAPQDGKKHQQYSLVLSQLKSNQY